MVGLAIGLIGIVAMFQAVSVWSKHTAATTSGGDAQVAGTLALFNIERDVKQAGHGFGRAPTFVMGSPVALTDTAPVRAFNFALSSVQINPGAGGAPDQISILYGDSSFYVEENDFTGATAVDQDVASARRIQGRRFRRRRLQPRRTAGERELPARPDHGRQQSRRPHGRPFHRAVRELLCRLVAGIRFALQQRRRTAGPGRHDVQPRPAAAPRRLVDPERPHPGPLGSHQRRPGAADRRGSRQPEGRIRRRSSTPTARSRQREWQIAPPADWRTPAGDPGRRPGAQPALRAQRRHRCEPASAPPRRPRTILTTSATPSATNS